MKSTSLWWAWKRCTVSASWRRSRGGSRQTQSRAPPCGWLVSGSASSPAHAHSGWSSHTGTGWTRSQSSCSSRNNNLGDRERTATITLTHLLFYLYRGPELLSHTLTIRYQFKTETKTKASQHSSPSSKKWKQVQFGKACQCTVTVYSMSIIVKLLVWGLSNSFFSRILMSSLSWRLTGTLWYLGLWKRCREVVHLGWGTLW